MEKKRKLIKKDHLFSNDTCVDGVLKKLNLNVNLELSTETCTTTSDAHLLRNKLFSQPKSKIISKNPHG